jgi:hypothetical protein
MTGTGAAPSASSAALHRSSLVLDKATLRFMLLYRPPLLVDSHFTDTKCILPSKGYRVRTRRQSGESSTETTQ